MSLVDIEQFLRRSIGGADKINADSLFGPPFPTTLSDIPRTLLYAIGPSLAGELKWTTAMLAIYAAQLEDFCTLRSKAERSLLSGDLQAATSTCDEIEQATGKSLWLLELKFALAEQLGGLTQNRELLKSIRADASNNSPIIAMAQFYSARAEANVSADNHSISVDSFCRRLLQQNPSNPVHQAVSHLRFRLNFRSFNTLNDLGFILYREGIHPVVDQYETLIRVAQLICSTQIPVDPAVGDCIAYLQDRVSDSRLTVLRHFLSDGPPVVPDSAQDLLTLAADAYTLGDYSRAAEHCSNGIFTYPDCFDFYELLAKSKLYLGLPIDAPFASGSLAANVMAATYSVLARGDDTTSALDRLYKLAGTLGGTRIGVQLLAFALKAHQPWSELGPEAMFLLGGFVLSARHSTLFRTPGAAEAFLASFRSCYSHSPACELFGWVRRGGLEAVPPGTPPLREQIYRAQALLESGDVNGAIEVYRRIPVDAPPPAREMAILGLCRAYVRNRQFDDCADLIARTYHAQKSLLLAVPIDTILEYHKQTDAIRTNNISWPILFHIQKSSKGDARDNADLFGAYSQFLISLGLDRPNQLADARDQFDPASLIAFLRDVCVVDVMDWDALSFQNSSEVENERIAVCQLLLRIDTANADVYSQEIIRLTQAGMVRRAIQHLDESKIYIDTVGIGRSLDKTFKERFDRYIAYSRLTESLRTTLKLRGFVLEEKDDSSIIVVSDNARDLFETIFMELRTRFISSGEYGLDSYLSVRIRHGTLSGQIRSQFEKENLITRKSKADGVYDRNTHWAETFSRFGQGVELAADAEMKEFSRKIDAIIDAVKKQWIQIKSANNPDGMFDFDYSDEDIFSLYLGMLEIGTYEDFIESIFAKLWDRTEKNLRAVVARITGDLNQMLTSALDQMSSRVFALNESIRHSSFGVAITRCRTQIQNEVDTIAAWFKIVDEKRLVDFNFGLLVDTAVGIVRNCFPAHAFEVVTSINTNVSCDGRRFTCFVDIFYILLENIVRHSMTRDLKSTILVAAQDDLLTIEVTNHLGVSADIVAIRAGIERLADIRPGGISMKALRTEGGTGFHKLHKLIMYDLGRNADYDVVVSVDNDVAFKVVITMSLKGLLA